MTTRQIASPLVVLAVLSFPTSAAPAGPPSPAHSDCGIAVTQAQCLRPECLASVPIVLRLCPAGEFDTAIFSLVVRDDASQPVPGIPVKAVELSGTVHISAGGATSDITDASGRATVELRRASGAGRLGICAAGVVLCEVEIRTFDVAAGFLPAQCAFASSGPSTVNVSDVTNPVCGFLARFGLVTPGVNASWDLNCDGVVNAADVNGTLCPPCGLCGSWYTHAFHGHDLSLGSCP